jgi:hypothetical protein
LWDPSSPGIAVRRTASLLLAYDRAIQYSETLMIEREALEYSATRFPRVVTVSYGAPLRSSPVL